jgi:hypothetical protein
VSACRLPKDLCLREKLEDHDCERGPLGQKEEETSPMLSILGPSVLIPYQYASPFWNQGIPGKTAVVKPYCVPQYGESPCFNTTMTQVITLCSYRAICFGIHTKQLWNCFFDVIEILLLQCPDEDASRL